MATNLERSEATRTRLTQEARLLFARDGFAPTSTEAILQAAGVQRGALYHHFADKATLFEAVCEAISEEAVIAIEQATRRAADPLDVLVRGSIAWIEFTMRPDVRRILIVDAPTVLGWERWEALDRRLSYQALHHALSQARGAGMLAFSGDLGLLTTMINGALNALALKAGAPGKAVSSRAWHTAVHELFAALAPGRAATITPR